MSELKEILQADRQVQQPTERRRSMASDLETALAMTETPEQAMQRQGVAIGIPERGEETGSGTATSAQEMAATARKPRSDKGQTRLPPRKSLLLSRAASARFVRVAAQLKGGEEELTATLEPWIDKLFGGELAFNEAGEFDTLEDLAIAAVAARMKGGADES